MVDVTPTCVSRYSRRGLGRHGHHPSEITGRKRLEEHLAAVPLTTRLLAPNGRAFDEALDPSAPPASFAQQQIPGYEILAGRVEALVPRQTVLAPGVHVRGPGLYAVHHPEIGRAPGRERVCQYV